MKQNPSCVQHAPRQGFGLHVPVGDGTELPGQVSPATNTHRPFGRQHAVNTTSGHWLGKQVLPGAAVVPVGQTDPKYTKHEPSLRQQAIAHGLGWHVLPGAGVVPAGQVEPVNVKHTSRSQHAITHGLGLQVAPGK